MSGYHESRLSYDPRREVLWRTLCDACFNRLIAPDAHVVELGAGYAHFINNVRAARRTAIDLWPGLTDHAAPGVEAHVANVTALGMLADSSVDFAFASNLFEHLSQADFAATLAALKPKLTPGGTLNILQPNYRRAWREYFDDYTHVAVYSDISLCDFLAAHGYRVIECVPGFLPLSVKSRLPVSPFLIRLYLRLPVKPMAKQMWIRAVPA
jgi:hypothetical protein